ncbi:MAG: glycosyltransferase [Patescibacteria group bacterium]
MSQKNEKEEIYLSIIVPFKNEEKRLRETIKQILEYTGKCNFKCQIILSDSHSNDHSLEIAKEYAKKFDHIEYTEPKDDRKGKGQAIQDGIWASNGKYVLFMDADSSTKIFDVDKLLPFANNYEIVMGSRYIKEPHPYQSNYFQALFHGIKSLFEVLIFGHSKDYMAKGKQGRLRQFISRGGNLAFAVLLNQSYIDQRCGFKLYRAPIAKFLAGLQRIYHFGFDTEYLAIAQKYKFKTIEIPVDWFDVAEGATVNPIKDSINSFRDIFKVQWNLISGKYNKKNARKKLGNLFEEVILNWK